MKNIQACLYISGENFIIAQAPVQSLGFGNTAINQNKRASSKENKIRFWLLRNISYHGTI